MAKNSFPRLRWKPWHSLSWSGDCVVFIPVCETDVCHLICGHLVLPPQSPGMLCAVLVWVYAVPFSSWGKHAIRLRWQTLSSPGSDGKRQLPRRKIVRNSCPRLTWQTQASAIITWQTTALPHNGQAGTQAHSRTSAQAHMRKGTCGTQAQRHTGTHAHRLPRANLQCFALAAQRPCRGSG